MDYTQHPLSAAFPRMSVTDLDALFKDIEANGQMDDIILYEGEILDGWHRLGCLNLLDVKPRIKELPSELDPVAFVISKNVHRRHITASQRAVAIASCHEWQPRGGSKATRSPLKTTEELAEIADVSRATMTDAKAVIKAGKADEVKNGHASVKSIARPAKPKPEPEVGEEPVYEHQEEDLGAALQDADKMIKERDLLITSLQSSDIAKELSVQHGRFNALSGRTHQLTITNSELQKTCKYNTELLGKIRKELGVEKNIEILPAIKALK